jgi:predicted nucleotidyltransferase
MTLLEQLERRRYEDRERERYAARLLLRDVLSRLLPGQRVFVYGSITRAGKFTGESDIDIALESEPLGMTVYQLISLLGEEMGRRVDVALLDECRFKDKIMREGELWTPQD